jgi:CHAT domain-containing protein
MRQFLIFLILYILSFDISAQDTDKDSLVDLWSTYHESGEFDRSLDVSLEIYDISVNAKESEWQLLSLILLSKSYFSLEDYNKSLSLGIESLEILRKINITGWTEEEVTIEQLKLSILNTIAESYRSLGDYNQSLEINLECVQICKEIYSNDNSLYIISLSNLALSYSNLELYKESLEINLECVDLIEEFYGKENEDYLRSVNNIAAIYLYFEDYNKVLDIYIECCKIGERIYSKNNIDFLTLLSNLSIAYSSVGNYQKALEISLDVVSSYKKYNLDSLPSYHQKLNNLALVYLNLEDYNKSLELLLECLNLNKNLGFNKYHILNHPVILNLNTLYYETNDYEKSLNLLLDLLSSQEDLFDKEDLRIGETFSLLAYTNFELGNLNEACNYFSKYQKISLSYYKNRERFLNDNLVYNLHSAEVWNFNNLFNFLNSVNDNRVSDNVKEIYNISCFLKNRELSNKNVMSSSIYASNDQELIKLYQDWIDINKEIGETFEMTLEDVQKLDLSKLQEDADRLERQLTKRSTVFASNQRNYSFNDIVSNLKLGEIYVDISKVVNYYNFAESVYYAYVIQKDDTIPQLVNLGSSSGFDSIYNYYSNYTQERPSNKEFSYGDIVYGNICYQNFWSKLEPYLEGVSTIYFSPEGVYSKINPNVLYDSTSSSFLIDKYDIVYLSNVEDFVHQKENIQLYERPDDLHAIIIGNPTFLLGEDEVVLATNEPQSRSINQDELDSLQRGSFWGQLPGTKKEIDLISSNLKSKGWDVEVISGVDATETRVKSIEAPKILHIATHGFFFEDQEMVKLTKMISTGNKKAMANPMTRSGLVFTGANNTGEGKILKNDNGYLNSYEASLLNLRGTELVVLSACETGSGDVQNGKGVYGLQRAIRVAGAESLIMSMWKVDDKATQELMTYFYDYWIDKNMSKKDAFNKAQQKIREKYKHPYYWGAFIMLGE